MAAGLSADRPLSVVVLGNSLSVLSVPGRSGHRDGIYAEVLRDRLTAAGVPTRVHLEGRWFDFATKARWRYEQSVRAHLPDVVVLQFGLNESQPWLLPVGVVRHFLTVQEPTTRLLRAYRARVSPRVWPYVRSYRRWAAGRVGTRTWQTTPRRFEAALRALVGATRADSRPLVLLLDVEHPGSNLRHFLPGMEERHAVVQRSIRAVVSRFADPEVRLVEVSALLSAEDPEVMPDTIHYSPEGHRRVGELLAGEVLRWLQGSGADRLTIRPVQPPAEAGPVDGSSTRSPLS